MIDIVYLLRDLFTSKTLQEFINKRYSDKDSAIVNFGVFKLIRTDKNLFYLDNMVCTIDDSLSDYSYDDVRPTDIVLDIGGCVGGFTLEIARSVKHVYAVEPVLTDRLLKNIGLNEVNNITIFDFALGSGTHDIEYAGITKEVTCKSLHEIIEMCGEHVDFLKCDCEGCEWSITPDEIKHIRRIEMEYHLLDKSHKLKNLLHVFDEAGFKYTVENKAFPLIKYSRHVNAGLIHAHKHKP